MVRKWRGVNHFINGFSNATKKGNIAEASKVLADLNRWYQTRPEKLQDVMDRQSKKWTQPRADFINAMVKENTLMSKAVEYMSSQLGSLMVDNGISEQLEALASQQVFNPSPTYRAGY